MISNLWKTSSPITISGPGAETRIIHQVIDLSKILNKGDVAAVEMEVRIGATAPGAARTLTAYAAFSSRADATPTELATAATSKIIPLVNVAGENRIYTMPVYEIGARYLHIYFDHTALDAGATLALTIYVNAKTT